MNKVIHILIVLMVCFITQGYTQSAADQLRQYSEKVRVNSSVSLPEALLKEEKALEVLGATSSYISDSVAQVRYGIYALVSKIGLSSQRAEVREQSVNQLIAAGYDKDGGNVGAAFSWLALFHKEDYTSTAKENIKKLFQQRPAHLDQLLKLIGYLEIVELKEDIRPLSLAPTAKRDRWAALVALARMGDNEAIQSVKTRSQKIKVSDDVVYEIFPDLIYTRHQELIQYMVTELNSEEKNCLSGDEKPILCGYRVMEQLAPVVEGYPLKLDASGDVDTKDYAKALIEVRKWFQKQGMSYKINKDTF